jgi:crotonobetainyl-CoA:carnitine CoA-transferase CaiB-like acyl-CoA transferase
MAGVLDGVRVVEVASYQLVPAAAAALAEFGAQVVKVEPLAGDPQRKLRTATGAPSPSMSQTNRNKRSVAIDIGNPAGHDVLLKLVTEADVFMTNLRRSAAERLRIDEATLRAHRPGLVYARGSALGPAGPDADRPGFDITAYWARGGIANALTERGAKTPVGQRPGFGDKQAAMNLAFGVAAALVRRARTGEGALVETSLLAGAAWALSSDIVASAASGRDQSVEPVVSPGPLNATLRTADDRWLRLQLMDGEAWWPELCERLGRYELAADSRFATAADRQRNAAACVAALADAIAGATLAQWRERFAGAAFPWEPNQGALELLDDPQVQANDLVPAVTEVGGRIRLVRAPVVFDGRRDPLAAAPALGEHTEKVLAEAGVSASDIAALRDAGVIG